MPLYSFYPSREDGYAATLICAELADDLAALRHADDVLAAHASAVKVWVFEGDRRVTAPPAPDIRGDVAALRKNQAELTYSKYIK